MPKLLEALGDMNPFLQHGISIEISKIATSYRASYGQPTVSQTIHLLKQFLAIRASERKVWNQLAPVHRAIHAAGYLKESPELEESELLEMLATSAGWWNDLDDTANARDLDIEFLIKNPNRLSRLLNRSHQKDYRKRLESAVVVEPFLRLLKNYGVVSTRARPLTKMLEALYLVIGIKNPPSDEGVRQIVLALKNKTKS
jgi:hypothetical protein